MAVTEKDDNKWLGTSIDILMKLGALAILIGWCYRILQPFMIMIVWGLIIAVASYPTYENLRTRLRLREGVAGILMALLLVAAIVVPVIMISDIVIEGSRQLLALIKQGDISLPEPPDKVKDWPMIGPTVWYWWHEAATNMVKTLAPFQPQLKAVGTSILKNVGGLSLAVLQFVFSIAVAAVFLAHADAAKKLAAQVSYRLVGDGGIDIVALVSTTIRSVTRGILGVAFIQAMLAGLGFVVMGIPWSGLLTLVCLMLCIVQIGPMLVTIPVVIYVFSAYDTTPAVLFTIYVIFVSFIDNVLKPLLLGRGVKVPMLVIFVGAIGGFVAEGVIGLFVGAVILVLTYQLGVQWLKRIEDRQSLQQQENSRETP